MRARQLCSQWTRGAESGRGAGCSLGSVASFVIPLVAVTDSLFFCSLGAAFPLLFLHPPPHPLSSLAGADTS